MAHPAPLNIFVGSMFKQQSFGIVRFTRLTGLDSGCTGPPIARANDGWMVSHETRMSLEITSHWLEVQWQNLARMCGSS